MNRVNVWEIIALIKPKKLSLTDYLIGHSVGNVAFGIAYNMYNNINGISYGPYMIYHG